MTPGQRIKAIMEEERRATACKLSLLPLPPVRRREVADLVARLTGFLNAWVGERDKVSDYRVELTALALVLSDSARIAARLLKAGLAPAADGEQVRGPDDWTEPA